MVHHNQVNKETTALWFSKQTSRLRTYTTSSLSCSKIHEEVHTIEQWVVSVQVWYACHTRTHTCFPFFNHCIIPLEFPIKRETVHSLLKTVRSTIFSWSCGVQEQASRRAILSMGRFSVWLSSQAHLSCLFKLWEVTKGPQVFYHEYNVSTFKVAPLHFQWLPSGIQQLNSQVLILILPNP